MFCLYNVTALWMNEVIIFCPHRWSRGTDLWARFRPQIAVHSATNLYVHRSIRTHASEHVRDRLYTVNARRARRPPSYIAASVWTPATKIVIAASTAPSHAPNSTSEKKC
jgi:hypothetical protein